VGKKRGNRRRATLKSFENPGKKVRGREEKHKAGKALDDLNAPRQCGLNKNG